MILEGVSTSLDQSSRVEQEQGLLDVSTPNGKLVLHRYAYASVQSLIDVITTRPRDRPDKLLGVRPNRARMRLARSPTNRGDAGHHHGRGGE
jgi:hypothetical protein